MPLILAVSFALALAQEPRVLAELPETPSLEGARTVFAPGGVAAAVVYRDGFGEDARYQLWHDDALSDAYPYVGDLRFSADGRHLAYRRSQAREEGSPSWEIVLDGRAEGGYDWVGPPTLRPDGREVAYWAGEGVQMQGPPGLGQRQGGRYLLVAGGQASEDPCRPGPEAWPPVYRADGKELAYLALEEDGYVVKVGKKTHGPYMDATGPVYAPAGKTCGWVGVPVSGRGAVLIGRKEVDQGASALGAPAFAGKGKVYAYPTKRDGQLVVVRDEEVIGESFGRLGRISLSEDGKQIAFVGSTSSATSSTSVSGQTVVLDSMQLIGREEFGGDGVSWSLVVNGQVISGGWNYLGQPVFTAKGDFLAVPARKGEDWHLLTVRIGKKGALEEGMSERFDAVGPPAFLKDGSVQFGARRERELLQVTLPISAED